jgi:hypothetical protein
MRARLNAGTNGVFFVLFHHGRFNQRLWRISPRSHNDQFTFQCDRAANDFFIEVGLTELDFFS